MSARFRAASRLIVSVAVHVGAVVLGAPWIAAPRTPAHADFVPIQLVTVTEPLVSPPPPPPPPPVIKPRAARPTPLTPPRLASRPEIAETPPSIPAQTPQPIADTPPAPAATAPTTIASVTSVASEGAGSHASGIAASRGDGPGITIPAGNVGSNGGRDVGVAAVGKGDGLTGFARPRGGYQTRPVYPESARRAGLEGVSTLRFEVRADGTVGAIAVERSAGFGELDRAAVAAVRTWRFEPARRGNDAVAVWVTLPVRFELRGR